MNNPLFIHGFRNSILGFKNINLKTLSKMYIYLDLNGTTYLLNPNYLVTRLN